MARGTGIAFRLDQQFIFHSMDRYVVIGNPVAHSLSPEIHAQFARARGETITYERLLAPPG